MSDVEKQLNILQLEIVRYRYEVKHYFEAVESKSNLLKLQKHNLFLSEELE